MKADFAKWFESRQNDRSIGLVFVLIMSCALTVALHVMQKVIA